MSQTREKTKRKTSGLAKRVMQRVIALAFISQATWVAHLRKKGGSTKEARDE